MVGHCNHFSTVWYFCTMSTQEDITALRVHGARFNGTALGKFILTPELIACQI